MERIDDLQRNGLRLIQNTELFCFGTDAVLLADFAKIKKNDSVVDLGTGTGILPVLLYGRQPQARFFAVEIQPELFALAERNFHLNAMEDRTRAVCGDLVDAYQYFGGDHDVVVANPPYEKGEDGAPRKGGCHLAARKEVLTNFGEICASAARLLRTGGRFYFIHKAARLAELFYRLKESRLEPKLLRTVSARADAEPKYVLVCAAKDAREGIRILPQLAMYGEDGRETDEVMEIYHGEREL